MRLMAESAWVCGDPGIQFDTTINDWHTCANTDRIYASNPCSEYMFLDDSACNLSSLNLMRFYDEADGGFDVPAFRHSCEVMITAMEIIVGNASYPTPRIAENSERFRPLGLGYANLGALLMARGIPYDSDAGRDYAAAITALMSGAAYAQSARIAETTGPFAGFEDNREPMLRVMRKHREAHQGARSGLRAARPAAGRARVVGRGDRARRAVRAAQQPDLGAGAHRHHRVHDGLRHHRRRARHRARQVQEAGRRRRHQDRQQDGAARAQAARLRQGPGAAHRRARRRAGHHRGRRRPAGRAPAGVRLRVPSGQRLAVDPLPRPPQDAGRHSAVHLGRDLEDHQHARDLDGRGHRRRLPRGLEAGLQGGRHLPRRLQAQPAAVDPPRGRAGDRARGGAAVAAPQAPAASRSLVASSCPTSAGRSPTSSRSTATRATSRSASTTTASRARSSSPWRSRARRCRAWSTPSRPASRSRSSTACRCARWSTSSRTRASSRRGSPPTPRSRSRSRSPTTSSAGWRRSSCRPTSSARWA